MNVLSKTEDFSDLKMFQNSTEDFEDFCKANNIEEGNAKVLYVILMRFADSLDYFTKDHLEQLKQKALFEQKSEGNFDNEEEKIDLPDII